MSNANLIKFRDLLASDAEFQEKFRKAAEAYDGPKDEKSVFEKLILPLAEEHGLSATYEEFSDYIDSFRGTEGELSDDELEQVAGGKSRDKTGIGFCLIVGAGDLFGSPPTDGYRLWCEGVGISAVCPGVG